MEDLIEKFQSESRNYDDLEKKVCDLIDDLLNDNNIKCHKIESRVKTQKSLDSKIKKKEYKYKSLNEITDILGIRIITFFEDEVET